MSNPAIVLPVKDSEERKSAQLPAPRVLVVEGDPAVEARLRLCLEDAGCDVQSLGDPHAALVRCRAASLDLVVADLALLRPGDFSLLGAFVQTRTPVVLITRGDETQSLIDAALLGGARDLISRNYLDTAVARHLVDRNLELVRLAAENRIKEQRLEELNATLQGQLEHLQADQQAGREVQLKMFPNSPSQMGEYRFEHQMFPSLFLSGDYVDYYTVGDHHTVFFIADVSGHGASSAFVTVLLKHLTARARSALWRLGDRTVLSPAESIKRLNEELLASKLDKHVTMFGGVLNRKTNNLRYCIAGHLPLPVLVSEDGARFLQGEGMPVGLFANAQYRDFRVHLPERFSLFAFSDGLLEILEPTDVNLKEQQLLAQFSAGDPGIDGLLERLGLEQIEALPDDITVMRISRH